MERQEQPFDEPAPTLRQPGLNPVRMLMTDHDEIRNLFDQFNRAEGEDRDDRMDVLTAFLVLHARTETDSFYPALRNVAGPDRIARLSEEHDEMDEIMVQLWERNHLSLDFESLSSRLEQLVRRHLEEEEQDIFPLAREVLGATVPDILDDMIAIRNRINSSIARDELIQKVRGGQA